MKRAIVFVLIGLPLYGASGHVNGFIFGMLAALVGIVFLVLAAITLWSHGHKTGCREGRIEGIKHERVDGITEGKRLGEQAGRAAVIGRPMHQDQLPNGTWLVLARHPDPLSPFVVLRTASDPASVPLLVTISREADFLRMTVGKPIRSVRSYSGGVVTFDDPDRT